MAAVLLVFAVYLEDRRSLESVRVLVESLRTFGGAYANATVRVYLPADLLRGEPEIGEKLADFHAEVHPTTAPAEALRWPYGGKVFAASQAEQEIVREHGLSREVGTAATERPHSSALWGDGPSVSIPILVWMDEDTVILQEPSALALPEGAILGWRPVMHNRIGPVWGEKPDSLWSRIYKLLEVPASRLFPMKTVADGMTLGPHFNAGLLAVRPERGILAAWAEAFSILYKDSAVVSLCDGDRLRTVFLHQAALAGAILNRVTTEEMHRLPDGYNYPIFFEEMFGADHAFDSLDDVTTLRHESYFRSPTTGWRERLKGPPELVDWLARHLAQGKP